MILLINEVFVQLRFSEWRKKNYWLAIRSTYPASNSTDSSHSKGTRKQFLSRIILAYIESLSHSDQSFPYSIRTIAMCRYTIITLLLDLTSLTKILTRTFDQCSFLWDKFSFCLWIWLCLSQIFLSTKFANGAHVRWFSFGLPGIISWLKGKLVKFSCNN